jgi:HK97 family phage prohead protease
MEIERRITLSDATIEYRDGENGEKRPVIAGYAAVFNAESRVLNGFVERIHPNAFDEVLSTNPDVIGVFNHDRNQLLGRTSNGTLKLTADGYGLRYELSPNEKTSVGKDVVEWVKDRTVVGSSFAFAIKKDGTGDRWHRDERGMQCREVRQVALLEDVGPVVRPAYAASSVVVSRRALETALGENYRPSQTMANAAKRGLKLAERSDEVDQSLVALADRIANREVVSVEECEYLAATYKRCLEAKAKGWNGTPAWIEWQLAGGDSGLRWVQRRAQPEPENPPAAAAPQPENREESAVSLVPTAGMAAAAKRGLKLHEDGRSGDGLKPETVARAKKIAAREGLTEDHVREMRAWFRRHKVDKRPGWNKAGEETPGYTAWMLWGGDPAWRWSEAKVAQMGEKRDVDEEEYSGALSERDLATAECYDGIAEELGPWAPAEAHYVADNPFAKDGIACRNCVFFEGEGACYVVSGEIAQDAVCKLWIIPEGRMSEQKTEEKPQKRDEAADAMAKAAALKATLLATRLHGATAAP